MSRIILKISGESLKLNNDNVSVEKLKIVLETVKLLQLENHKVAIVIGGGNFFRGREHNDMNKVTADTIGMLGTVMNALYIKDYLENNDIKAVVTTPFDFYDLIKKYNNEELNSEYNEGKVIIFGGGIGKSGFSTDSGVVLASTKLKSDFIIKMTNVDGVYDSDPNKNSAAKKYDKITYDEMIYKHLEVMDEYAILKCKENNTKIIVINILDYMHILDAIDGKQIGTLIGD